MLIEKEGLRRKLKKVKYHKKCTLKFKTIRYIKITPQINNEHIKQIKVK